VTNVSVIIPVYNREHTIIRAIDSVISQSFSDWELIIIDDGSTDQTASLIQSQYEHNVILKSIPTNQGVSTARNLGVKLSSGKWIAFLDSDDYWHPDKLSSQILFLNENPQYQISQTEEIWIRNGHRVNPKLKHKKLSRDLFVPSLELCLISPSSVILTRELFDQSGKFDEDLLACEDYDLWLRITQKNPVGLINSPLLTKTGGHADQLSSKFPAMDRFRIYSLLKLFSSGKLSPEQETATLKILRKKIEILVNGAKKRGNRSQELENVAREILSKRTFTQHKETLKQLLLWKQ